jgi:hypothetical protein
VWDPLLAADGSGPLRNHRLVNTWMNGFSRTIAAGTSQIQRNLIANLMGLKVQ